MISYQVIIKLISSKKTKTGLEVGCEIYKDDYRWESKSVTIKCARSTYQESIAWRVELFDRCRIIVDLFGNNP